MNSESELRIAIAILSVCVLIMSMVYLIYTPMLNPVAIQVEERAKVEQVVPRLGEPGVVMELVLEDKSNVKIYTDSKCNPGEFQVTEDSILLCVPRSAINDARKGE